MGSIKNFIEGILLSLKANPRSLLNRFSYESGEITVSLKDSPIHCRANRELVKTLSKVLNVSIDKIMIVKGIASRYKSIFIEGICAEKVEKKNRFR